MPNMSILLSTDSLTVTKSEDCIGCSKAMALFVNRSVIDSKMEDADRDDINRYIKIAYRQMRPIKLILTYMEEMATDYTSLEFQVCNRNPSSSTISAALFLRNLLRLTSFKTRLASNFHF